MDASRSFAVALRAGLTSRSMTPAALSRAAGVSESMLSRYLAGTRTPTYAVLARLARVMPELAIEIAR